MKKVAALFVVVASVLLAQQPTTDPPTLGLVSGVVIDVTTQQPLSKVTVNLKSATLPDNESIYGRTDDEGRFTVENVKAGRYRLYPSRNQYVTSDEGAAGSLRRNAVLDVGPGQVIDDIVLGLQPAAVITGRVVDEDGDPVEGLMVQALRAVYVDGAPQLLGMDADPTNDRGEYRIYGLPPGAYYVRVSAERLNLRNASGSTPADSVLTYVDTYYPNAQDVSQAILLRPTAAVELSGVDLRMTRTRTLRISGRVVDGETGRPGLSGFLALLNRDKSGEQPSLRRMNVRSQDGGFEGDGLRPGSYRLEASISLPDTTRGYAVHDFDLADQSIDNMELRTLPSFSVSGHVAVDGDTDIELPKPMQISLELPGPHSLLSPSALVEDNNQFLLESVVAESYRVGAYGLGALYLKAARYGGRDASVEPVRIEAGGGELEIVLSPNAARLDGQITQDGEGVAGAYVVLVPDDRTRKDLFHSVATDQYGVYAFIGIAPGRYKVFAWERIDFSAWLDPNILAAVESQGVRVELEEGDAKRVTPELIEAVD
jgi:hypothetical protein